jgi:hypothetical protein
MRMTSRLVITALTTVVSVLVVTPKVWAQG